MIDPRALQQHFNKVRQREQPQRQPIPRVLEPKPLTAVQAIPVTEPVVLEPVPIPVIEPVVLAPVQPSVDTSELQKELLEVTQALTTLKQTLTQTPQIEPITITVPVSVATVVTEVKEVKQKVEEEPVVKKSEPKSVEDENPYGYSVPKSQDDREEYNPYGYYSGPLF